MPRRARRRPAVLAAEQRPGLAVRHRQALVDADVVPVPKATSSTWPPTSSRAVRVEQQRGRRGLRGVRREQHLVREREHRVAGEDRRRRAPDRPHRRAVAALGVAVHEVVVQQREVVHQLDGHPAGHADGSVGRRTRAAASSASAGRSALPPPPGRPTVAVDPAQVVGGLRRAGRVEPVTAARSAGSTRSRQRRSTAATSTVVGSTCAGTVAPSVVAAVTRRPAHGRRVRGRRIGAGGRGAPGHDRGRTPSAAHGTLHRRGPSGVGPRAGQHERRAARSGRPVVGRRCPGAGRNVAWGSRVTKTSSSRAPAAAGSSRPSSVRNRSTSVAAPAAAV